MGHAINAWRVSVSIDMTYRAACRTCIDCCGLLVNHGIDRICYALMVLS